MSTSRKVIKILSILTVIDGLLLAVAGILMLTGVISYDDTGAGYITMHTEGGGSATAIAVGIMLVGIYALIEGFLGVRGANVPSKMFPFIIVTTGAVAYYATEFLHTLFSGNIGYGMLVNLAVNVIVFYMALKIYNESRA